MNLRYVLGNLSDEFCNLFSLAMAIQEALYAGHAEAEAYEGAFVILVQGLHKFGDKIQAIATHVPREGEK